MPQWFERIVASTRKKRRKPDGFRFGCLRWLPWNDPIQSLQTSSKHKEEITTIVVVQLFSLPVVGELEGVFRLIVKCMRLRGRVRFLKNKYNSCIAAEGDAVPVLPRILTDLSPKNR